MPIGLQHAHPGTPATRVMPHQELVWRSTAYPAPGSGVLCGATALAFADATAEAKEEKTEGREKAQGDIAYAIIYTSEKGETVPTSSEN